MRFVTLTLLTITLLILSGCSTAEHSQANANIPITNTQTGTAGRSASTTDSMSANANTSVAETTTSTTTATDRQAEAQQPMAQRARAENVSLSSAQAAQDAATAFDRKIIRNADLSLETNAPAEGQRKIASLVEARGGFVVTSETKQTDTETEARPNTTVTLVARVPSAQFSLVLDEIRKLGTRVRQEKITGQDVTEEYVDLEARIKTKKALEAQFLEIMKRAGRISDALEVQSQLADVRTDIERLEGRRRFLENQSNLSTINVTLELPALFLHTTGFFHSVKEAFGEGVDVAASITLALIRIAIVMIPITLFVFLPFGLLANYVLRRKRRRANLERQLQSVSDN